MSKRSSLVSYESSDEETQSPPPLKKRKLPTLASSLTVPVPVDNPALHQGRVRSSPHVEGQWASLVYIPIVLGKDEYLAKLLTKALDSAKVQVPSLQSVGFKDDSWELHISLTRPMFLRTHQREEFKKAVKDMARSYHAFPVSFANFAQLTNDEKTRVFLTVEVGAGFDQLRQLSEALIPTLRAIRQQEFYPEPRFHASIAWALLDRPTLPSSDSPEFVTIPDLPVDLTPGLNREYSLGLQRTVASVDAVQVQVKIGKDVVGWQMGS